MTPEAGQTLALQALEWLAGETGLMDGFLAASGASLADIKSLAAEPGFLASVLDYLMTRDDWIRAFCDENRLDYLDPMRARQVLPGGDLPNWT